MNDAQSDGDNNDERNKNYKDEEEREEGTNAAEVDDEMLDKTDQNKKRKVKDNSSNKKGRQVNHQKDCLIVGEKLGSDIMCWR